jgi:predicted ATP-dependent protease
LLVRKIREDEVAPQEAIPELYLSNKREQIIKRDNKLLQKENMQRLADKKKDIDKQIKEEAAAKAKAKEDTKNYNAEWNKLARKKADKARLKKGLSRTNWRGEPIKGFA